MTQQYGKPRVALLSIGNELLCGEVVDTNVSYISGRLFEKGYRVLEKRCVGDDRETIAATLLSLARTHDCVIATGGLGPTEDDLTPEAAATAAECRLVQNPVAVEHLARFAKRLHRELHPENQRQTLLPETAQALNNPLGTACGFSLRVAEAICYFLPGVPYEMERMIEESVLPGLRQEFGERSGLLRKTLKLFGIPEADTGARLKGLLLPPGIELAYCVRFPEVHVILRGPAGGEIALQEAAALVRQKVGDHLVAEDKETIDTVLASLFIRTDSTLSLAESCTGGMIAARITALAGSSAYFLEGAVTYSNAAKSRVLGVPEELIEENGAVSVEVARAMAIGARRASGSTLALSVTGIAGPDGGSIEKPVGTVFIALADPEACAAKGYLFPGDRERVRLLTTYTALNLVRRRLIALQEQQGI